MLFQRQNPVHGDVSGSSAIDLNGSSRVKNSKINRKTVIARNEIIREGNFISTVFTGYYRC